MKANIIWYRTRPTDELVSKLRNVLHSVGAQIEGQQTTIRSEQMPPALAAALRGGELVMVIGGMDQHREEDNTIFILSKCLSLRLEPESFSRSKYIFDPLRGRRLPSFDSAVLFPSSSGESPEGVVVSKGMQTLIVLPELDFRNEDILQSLTAYLPAIVNYIPIEKFDEQRRQNEEREKHIDTQISREEAIREKLPPRKNTVVPDQELTAAELRGWFAHQASADSIAETNTLPESAVRKKPQPKPKRSDIPWNSIELPEPEQISRHTRFVPHDSDYISSTDGKLQWYGKRFIPVIRATSMVVIVAVIITAVAVGLGNYSSGVIEKPVLYQSELNALYDEYAGDGTLPKGFPEGALPKFAQLFAANGNVRGYISIPGSDLAQPIVMSDPAMPDYNASQSFYGEYDTRGTLYFDPSINISLGVQNPNLVVYGNSNTDGSMFAALKNYTDADYLASHQLINLDTLYDSSQWIVFSVCCVSGDTINEFNYANTGFYGRYDRQTHLYNLYIRSMFYTATEVFPDEDMITLVTDYDAFKGAKLLVCARKVREEEDLSYLGSGITKNDSVLMPDLWYKVNHVDERPNVPMLEIPTEDDSDVYTTPAGYTTTTAAPTTKKTAAPTTATTAANNDAQPTNAPDGDDDVDLEELVPIDPDDVSGSDGGDSTAEYIETTTTEPPAPTTKPPSYSVPDMKITSNGKVISAPAAEILAMIAEAEIGGDCNVEAIKAQVVAAYTFYLYSGGSAKAPSFPTKTATAKCKEAADAVAGQYMTANGTVPYTPYYATSAGRTAFNRDVNGTDLSYLVSVDCSVDESVKGFKTVKELSAAEVAKKVKAKKGIDLTAIPNKNEWFEVTERDENGLYVKQVRVGDRSFKGTTLHLSILGYTCLRSPAFWIEYDSGEDMFRFTSLGYGTGVGMSQTGAAAYAAEGKNYVWILQHFYSGVEIKSK